MGYHTTYTLRTYNDDRDISEILENISSNEFDWLGYAIDECGDYCDSVNWYNHEEDMKVLSSRFPDVTLELYGEGEESGDVWNKYFKNGKMQVCRAKITFDGYDENKLT